MAGFVKFYRGLLDHHIVHKDNDYLAVWMFLLLNANHESKESEFNYQTIEVKPGQLIRGRKQIAEKAKVNESKVERILNRFEREQMIDQQKSPQKRLITVLNWSSYQKGKQPNEQPNEQPMNNQRTTDEQQMNTNKNIRIKEVKNKDSFKDIVEKVIAYLKCTTGHTYKQKPANSRHLIARLNQGYSMKDSMTVIRLKTIDWEDNSDMKKYLRPETLFGTKFDSYLQSEITGRTAAELDEMINQETRHLETMTGPWSNEDETTHSVQKEKHENKRV